MSSKNLGFRQTGTISLTGRVDNPRQNELSSIERPTHPPLIIISQQSIHRQGYVILYIRGMTKFSETFQTKSFQCVPLKAVCCASAISMLLMSSADFFQNQPFQKRLSGTLSECQTIWIQIRTHTLWVLIWVQTVLQWLSTDDKSRC